mmetsp:Transcript_12083/g.33961  ORF Transcript_12083/g.33961 Transcript_12083/m.33961 type:complete len:268 (+) Transcript_12083:1573-2376(+)
MLVYVVPLLLDRQRLPRVVRVRRLVELRFAPKEVQSNEIPSLPGGPDATKGAHNNPCNRKALLAILPHIHPRNILPPPWPRAVIAYPDIPARLSSTTSRCGGLALLNNRILLCRRCHFCFCLPPSRQGRSCADNLVHRRMGGASFRRQCLPPFPSFLFDIWVAHFALLDDILLPSVEAPLNSGHAPCLAMRVIVIDSTTLKPVLREAPAWGGGLSVFLAVPLSLSRLQLLAALGVVSSRRARGPLGLWGSLFLTHEGSSPAASYPSA